MSFYAGIAEYYDFIFPFSKAQIDFIKTCLEEPYQNKAVLDIGCGTGDLVIALSDIGFHATGIDSDAVMLRKVEKKAKSRMESRMSFVQMDMKAISISLFKSGFDAAFCFGNTLVHLNGISEIEAFCKQIKVVLKENGMFLLQILNYDHILDHNITKLPLIENDAVTFVRDYEYDDKKNLMKFKTSLIVKETGKRIENEILLYPIRKYELDQALRKAGFTRISYYAGFDKSILQDDSLPLVAEAL
jgi:glycine/sarcosine N-methyltransferase